MAYEAIARHCTPQYDNLRPIRVGAVASQPAPALSAVLYTGLADLLPACLRVLCSSAGLVYLRVHALRAGGDLFDVEVAALPHYFDAPSQTRDCHVRRMVLPADDFACLLEWDRNLAGRPTYEVRELLAERQVSAHVVCVRKDVSVPAHSDIACRAEATDDENDVYALEPEPETLILPLETIREAVGVGVALDSCHRSISPRPSRATITRMLVHYGLESLRGEIEEQQRYLDVGWRDRVLTLRLQTLRHQRQQLLRALRFQRSHNLPVQVELLPIYGREHRIISCRMDVYIPAAA